MVELIENAPSCLAADQLPSTAPTVGLRRKRVDLGPILPADLENVSRWVNDEDDEALYEPFRPVNWFQEDQFWLDDTDPGRQCLAIRVGTAATIAGFVQVYGMRPPARSATLVLCIGDRRARSQGLGRQALAAAVHHCWNRLGLARLEAQIFAHNIGARRICTELGFQQTALRRRALYIGGRWIDEVQMTLLRPRRILIIPHGRLA